MLIVIAAVYASAHLHFIWAGCQHRSQALHGSIPHIKVINSLRSLPEQPQQQQYVVGGAAVQVSIDESRGRRSLEVIHTQQQQQQQRDVRGSCCTWC